MKYLTLLLLIMMAGCSNKEQSPENKLMGSWSFLDARGNYNEACFFDTIYFTYNSRYGLMPNFRYYVMNDSLYSDVDKRRPGLHRIAKFQWLSDDKFILKSEFSQDTVERITAADTTLVNTDARKDSIKFRKAFNLRYEKFLLQKGILTASELEEFKKFNKIPDDLLQENQVQ